MSKCKLAECLSQERVRLLQFLEGNMNRYKPKSFSRRLVTSILIFKEIKRYKIKNLIALHIFKLAEKPDEIEVATQTDYFLEKPITPKYFPDKVGQDIGTQIEPGEVHAFNILFLQYIHLYHEANFIIMQFLAL